MPTPNSPLGDEKPSDPSTSAAPSLEDELLESLPIAEKTIARPNSEASSDKDKDAAHDSNKTSVKEAGGSDESDELTIDWDGPNDPQNPKK